MSHYNSDYMHCSQESCKTVTGDTAIDAAFEMIVWPKENGEL